MTRGLGKYYTWKEYLGTMITIALPVAMQNLLSTTASMVPDKFVVFLKLLGLCQWLHAVLCTVRRGEG